VFRRVTIRASDLAASEAFYDTVLAGVCEEVVRTQFAVVQASPEAPASERLHIGFRASTHAEVDEFWRAGVTAGYRDDGPPGPRPEYGPDYYGGFLLDPDGNSAEAVCNGDSHSRPIDHLWIRIADLAGARELYEGVGREAGFEIGWTADDPPRVGFRGADGSFSIVDDGPPTRNVLVEFSGLDRPIAIG
jgi:catechol 2,3-dioxygenase-like lactoylglutathione lyase family enzyme